MTEITKRAWRIDLPDHDTAEVMYPSSILMGLSDIAWSGADRGVALALANLGALLVDSSLGIGAADLLEDPGSPLLGLTALAGIPCGETRDLDDILIIPFRAGDPILSEEEDFRTKDAVITAAPLGQTLAMEADAFAAYASREDPAARALGGLIEDVAGHELTWIEAHRLRTADGQEYLPALILLQDLVRLAEEAPSSVDPIDEMGRLRTRAFGMEMLGAEDLLQGVAEAWSTLQRVAGAFPAFRADRVFTAREAGLLLDTLAALAVVRDASGRLHDLDRAFEEILLSGLQLTAPSEGYWIDGVVPEPVGIAPVFGAWARRGGWPRQDAVVGDGAPGDVLLFEVGLRSSRTLGQIRSIVRDCATGLQWIRGSGVLLEPRADPEPLALPADGPLFLSHRGLFDGVRFRYLAVVTSDVLPWANEASGRWQVSSGRIGDWLPPEGAAPE